MQMAAAQEIREAEQALFRSGAVTSAALMQRVVGRLVQAWRALPLAAGLQHPARAIVYAGKGNNAGDAIGMAAQLGCPVLIRCADAQHTLSPDSAALLTENCRFLDEAPEPAPDTLILDGLLGSGAAGELRPAYAALVQEMNALREASPRTLLLAVDIPTGLDSRDGSHGAAVVQADVTAAIGCVKPGLLADGAEDAVGRLLTIPLPEVSLTPCDAARVADAAEPCPTLPRRAYSCFKNRAGRVAIVAGSEGMTGAARLCAEAAVAAGAGLTVLYCHRAIYPILAAAVTPEVMVRPVDSYAEIAEPDAAALVVGPGLGTPAAEECAALLRLIENFPRTVVLDADGLNMAAREGWKTFDDRFILTPHPGEMRRLFPAAATLSRRETLRQFTRQHACTLLYKGARTLIGQGETVWYNSSGGPYMANGGQGDVLAGVIGALAAQGLPNLAAAVTAARACGCAAEHAWAANGYAPATPAHQVIQHLGQVL